MLPRVVRQRSILPPTGNMSNRRNTRAAVNTSSANPYGNSRKEWWYTYGGTLNTVKARKNLRNAARVIQGRHRARKELRQRRLQAANLKQVYDHMLPSTNVPSFVYIPSVSVKSRLSRKRP